jgi:Protein of unknown function (DUF1822)
MNQLKESITFPVPLSFSAHARAEELRRQQSNSQTAKQVYLNTLAVYAVDFYLRCLGVETAIEQSDSQNPLYLKFMNVADLQVKSIGKLECRPVLPDATDLEIPAEVRADRVGYLAVQFDRSLKQAQILGFTTTAAATIPLDQLQSIDAFPEYLQQLRLQNMAASQSAPVDRINLRQWMNNCFEESWQELQAIFSSDQPRLAFRSSDNSTRRVERGRLIQLTTPQRTVTVLLVVELNSLSNQDTNIRLAVLAARDQSYLPADLQVRILDAQQTTVMQAIAGPTNPDMEFDFNAKLSEQFSVEVRLGEMLFSENFVA